jgi:cobaltochelatase CobS
MNAHGDYVDTSGLYDAYKNGGTFIVDEIDNASPNVTVMLNTLMASDRYTFPNGETVERHESFRIVATANTFGTGPTATFAGRFPLDPSTLDRFSRMMVDYDRRIDTATAEKYLATADAVRLLAAAWKMRENIDAHGLRGFVTPRGIGRAAQYLAAGFPVSRIIDTLMPAGMNDGQRRQILESVSL